MDFFFYRKLLAQNKLKYFQGPVSMFVYYLLYLYFKDLWEP